MKRIFATRKVKKISPISPKENVYQVIIPLSVTTEKQLNAIFQLFFKKKSHAIPMFKSHNYDTERPTELKLNILVVLW
jgi:hypothetical protein